MPPLGAYLAEMVDADCRQVLATPASEAEPKQAEQCADKQAAQKKNYADLEQSVRSADATEYAAHLAYLQTCVGIVGAMLVTLTLFATAWAALAASEAARAADASVSLSARNAEAELRAYVFVKSVVAHASRPKTWDAEAGVFVEGPPVAFSIHLEIENSGSTPTRHLVYTANHQFFDGLIPVDFDFPDSGTTEQTVLAPRTVTQAVNVTLSADELKAAIAHEKHFYMWGWLDYSDVFEGTPRHRTEFGFKMETARLPGMKETEIRFYTIPGFNAADAECVRQPQPYKQNHL